MFWKAIRLNIQKLNFQNVCQMRYCSKSVINDDLLTFFQQNFGLPENEIKRIFNKYPSFYKDTYFSLHDNLSLLMDLGVSRDNIIKTIQVLTLHPITIKNYAMLLEEGGFVKNNIDASTILKFKYITKRSITSLKNENYVEKHIDVQQNMLSFTEFPKELYPEYCDDSLPWDIVQKQIFKLYIGWKINMDLESVNCAQTHYCRLHNKSFRLVEKSINTMLHDFNFTKEKIRRHSYLIHSDSDNALAILENFKHLCGVDTKLILDKHPKIILQSWKSIHQIQKHFEEFGIPESALAKVPQIYTLGSKTVYKRLCNLKEIPELASFLNNPQVVRLVYYYNKAMSRLKYLKSKNCVSLNLLVTSQSLFNRFHYNGNDKGKTNDTMIYLVSELGEDKQRLRTLLERHPYWQYISLLSIRKTYEFLKNKNFTKEQLCNCLHILLYPVHTVEEALISTQNMKNVSYLRDSSGSIKPEYLLPLVLYNLEKNHHFSGDGVWSSNNQAQKYSTSDTSKYIFDEIEELDHEPSAKLM